MRQKVVIPIEGCKCAFAFPLAGELPPVAATLVAPGNRTAEFWPAAADRSLPRQATLHAPPSPNAETLSRPLRFAVSHLAFRRGFSYAAHSGGLCAPNPTAPRRISPPVSPP